MIDYKVNFENVDNPKPQFVRLRQSQYDILCNLYTELQIPYSFSYFVFHIINYGLSSNSFNEYKSKRSKVMEVLNEHN